MKGEGGGNHLKSVDVNVDLADCAGISGLQGDEAASAPSGAPGVLDEPVAGIVPTDGEHGVVDVLGAVVEDSGSVERPVGGINTDGGRLLVDVGGEARAASVLGV